MLEIIMKKEIKNIENDILISMEIRRTSCESVNIEIKASKKIEIDDLRRLYRFEFMEELERIKSITTKELIEQGYIKKRVQTLWIDISGATKEMESKAEIFCNKVEKYIKMMF